jgi:hypothetical protein
MAQKITRKRYRKSKGPYRQKSVKKRIKAIFLDNLGKVLTREQIINYKTEIIDRYWLVSDPLIAQKGSFV